MVGRKIVQDSDDESNWGNSPPPADHESHDPSLDTSVDLPSSSSRMIIEQSEQPSTSSSSTGAYLCCVRHAMANLSM